MASLAHTRAGITDAMIQCNVVDVLCEKIYSTNEQIRSASAATLGYLTFNRTAGRLLIHNCRNNTTLFRTLMDNLRDDSRINEDFLLQYDQALKLGLPKLLIHNKVRFVEPLKSSRSGKKNLKPLINFHFIKLFYRTTETRRQRLNKFTIRSS